MPITQAEARLLGAGANLTFAGSRTIYQVVEFKGSGDNFVVTAKRLDTGELLQLTEGDLASATPRGKAEPEPVAPKADPDKPKATKPEPSNK